MYFKENQFVILWLIDILGTEFPKYFNAVKTQGQEGKTQGQVGGAPRYTEISPHTEGYPENRLPLKTITTTEEESNKAVTSSSQNTMQPPCSAQVAGHT